MNDVPVPPFDRTAFTVPPSLRAATVGIVTTAGLHHPDQEGWEGGRGREKREDGSTSPFWRADESFRILDGARRDLVLAQWSPNFDRSGFALDVNVVFPIDRLQEMAKEGAIGAVASRHASFVGAQNATLSTVRHDSGPAAAKVLRDAGADVVLLTPV